MVSAQLRTSVEIPIAPPGVRILLVDDDPRVRRVLATGLMRAGFHVFTAEDAVPALKLAEHSPPDLAIVDFNMPTPGIEVVRELKALHGSAIWIAVLSGDADDEAREACFDAGADDVIAKPAQLPELRRRMVAAARTQQAYVESRIARERADRLIAYGGEASAMLAHDLNNGLAVALSNLALLDEEITDNELLKTSLNALRRMSGLVANFVDIARFEDAAVRPEIAKCTVYDLIRNVIDVHAVSPRRPVRFEVECAPELVAMFDGALIERVLHNLVGNAVRYCTPSGAIRIAAIDRGEDGIELRVSNDGTPVSEEIRERLFAKYAKDASGRRGFGLYFCRLACEAHGGTITHVPAPTGTTFAIRLPR